MSAALTRSQKAYLAQLAGKAFARQREQALGRGESWERAVDDWRHAEVARACGKLGLRCCSQDDYGAVKARFLAMLGQEGRALKADLRGDPAANRVRQVRWKIDQELKRLGKAGAYAEGISRRMFRGRGLQDVGERELWKIFYALKYQ